MTLVTLTLNDNEEAVRLEFLRSPEFGLFTERGESRACFPVQWLRIELNSQVSHDTES